MAKKKIEIDVDVNSEEAVRGVNELGDSVDDLGKSTEKLSDANESLSDGLEGLGGGFAGAIGGAKALGKQFLALMANPIVAAIAAIAVVLVTLFKAFSRTEEGGNKLNKGMNLLKGVFNALLSALEPLANFIVDNVVAAFEALGKAAEAAAGLVSDALSFFGFDDAAKSLDNFVQSGKDLVALNEQISDLEAKLLKTRREQSLIEKQALIDAEKLRQQRDDESNSLAQRIEFNKQLGAVLDEQTKRELAIAKDGLKLAQLKIEANGKTTENLDALAEAQLEILDIEERINGQRSEQLANENSLRNEGIALRKEAAEKEAARLEEEEKLAKEKREQKRKERLEEQKLFNDEQDRIAKERVDNQLALEKKLEDEQKAGLERVTQFEKDNLDIRAKNTDAAIGIAKQLAGDNKELQAGIIVGEAALNIGRTIISTQSSNAAIVAEAAALAIPTAGASVAAGAGLVAANNIQAGLSVAGIALGAANALKGLKKSGAVSKPSVGGGGGGSASAPALNEQTLFSTQKLDGAESEKVGAGAGINQIKAVVVESDITNAQNTISGYENASELG